MKGFVTAKLNGLGQFGRRVQRVFTRPAFRVVVLVLSLALLFWPFMPHPRQFSGRFLFFFFFGAWLGIVVLLFGMGLSQTHRRKSGAGGKAPGAR
ncbi:hypothetical protein AAU61_06360 [Desulfocarbo indianensis]|nr:hypothetical protein AAU61_06360 [Desulfocarbo indianensis]